jgi:hypothetical protein
VLYIPHIRTARRFFWLSQSVLITYFSVYHYLHIALICTYIYNTKVFKCILIHQIKQLKKSFWDGTNKQSERIVNIYIIYRDFGTGINVVQMSLRPWGLVLLHAFTQPLLYTVTNLKYGVYRHLLC